MGLAEFDPTRIALHIVGAFYVFAGVVAVRAGLMSHFLDRAIAAIAAQKPKPVERAQAIWLISAAIVVLMGGAALILLLEAALWLFVLSALGQALYLLVLAPRYFDTEDPPDAAGRRQSWNAFVIYLAATAFVAWAALTGRLLEWRDVPWQFLAAAGIAIAAYAGHIAWQFLRKFQPANGLGAAGTAGEQVDPSRSRRIKVMADYGAHPLWALDEGLYGDFAPEDIGLSPDLCRDLARWADEYTASLNADDPLDSRWSDEQFLAHESAGRGLAERVAREKPDLTVFLHTREFGVVEVQAGGEA